jgi:hypothetical protein
VDHSSRGGCAPAAKRSKLRPRRRNEQADQEKADEMERPRRGRGEEDEGRGKRKRCSRCRRWKEDSTDSTLGAGECVGRRGKERGERSGSGSRWMVGVDEADEKLC